MLDSFIHRIYRSIADRSDDRQHVFRKNRGFFVSQGLPTKTKLNHYSFTCSRRYVEHVLWVEHVSFFVGYHNTNLSPTVSDVRDGLELCWALKDNETTRSRVVGPTTSILASLIEINIDFHLHQTSGQVYELALNTVFTLIKKSIMYTPQLVVMSWIVIGATLSTTLVWLLG